MLKRIVSILPLVVQQEARRLKLWSDIKRDTFRSAEPEFNLLSELVHAGDCVMDIGANVGYYTMRLSELAGPAGHVLAFEPMSATVEMLTFTTRFAPHSNITVFNTAASDRCHFLKFSVGQQPSGLPNYFLARAAPEGNHAVLAIRIDSLDLPRRVAFVKIDTEGAELSVLRGMEKLLQRDHPILVVEGEESLEPYLAGFGYRMRPRISGSPNLLFLYAGHALAE